MSPLKDRRVAVIGLACRVPGANSASDFWDNVARGVISFTSFSRLELERSGVSKSVLDDPNMVPVCGFLEGGDLFDAEFFNMKDSEASLTDPQHRLLLECAWEAMESSGHNPYNSPGRVGCFAGAGMSLYAGRRYDSYLTTNLLSRPTLIDKLVAPQITLANRNDYLSTKIAYFMDLRGPCLNVQTACSTGLTAVHLARLSLLAGECDLALAGAAAVQVPLKTGYVYEGGLLSPDGSCRPFDADACGTVGSSGVGVVVLRRLEDAIQSGDYIHAVITGSAMNNDGNRKVSFLAPGVEGQIQVISEALKDADVDPVTIGYVEAHGTGTPLGDPIEVASLTEAYRKWTQKRSYCGLGSAKANVGHLDSAAGIIGFIKAVLTVERGLIPKLAGFRRVNPKLAIDGSPFWIPTETIGWPESLGPSRRVAVSSFGAGGTNVHMVLESAPARARSVAFSCGPEKANLEILPISARSPAALNALLSQYIEYLGSSSDAHWPDIAYTAAVGRHHFAYRTAVVAQSTTEAARLCAVATQTAPHSTAAKSRPRPSVAFLFPGQGNLKISVVRQLYSEEASFREQFDECSRIYERLQKKPLTSFLSNGSPEQMQQAEVVQPMVFAASLSLAALWKLRGVTPSAVTGHSLGEYAAACLCGILDLETAMRLVEARGRLMGAYCPAGGMVALHAPPEHVQAILRQSEHTQGLVIAALNAPEAVVVAGPCDQCAWLVDHCRGLNLRSVALNVTHAFHSPLIEPMIEPFRRVVNSARFGHASMPLVSTVTGNVANAAVGDYWTDQLRKPVQFQAALQQLAARGHAVLLEIGTDAVLTHFAESTLGAGIEALPSVRAGRVQQQLTDTTAALYRQGLNISWDGVHAGRELHRMAIPHYPFQRRRYWIEAAERPNPPKSTSTPTVWEMRWRKDTAVTNTKPPVPSWLLLASDRRLVGDLQMRLQERGMEARIQTGDTSNIRGWLQEQGKRPHAILLRYGTNENSRDKGIMDCEDLFTLLNLTRELCSARLSGCELLIVTRGAQSIPTIGDDATCPAHAALWGFARATRRELPELRLRCLDVFGSPREILDQIMFEITSGTSDEEVGWRAQGRFTPILVQTDHLHPEAERLRLDKEGLYLLTGGFGGLGIHAATRLVQRGARHLILIGRNGVSDTARPYIESMRIAGAKMIPVAADVATDEGFEQLQRIVAQSKRSLRGIIHAAGVLHDAVLPQLEPSAIADVLKPKLLGAYNLDRLSRNCDLDFFIAFSSAAAFIGSPGQANYAAANAAMDSLVERRCADGLHGCSVRWGPWDEAGMAARQHRAKPAGFNFDPMKLKDGLAAFDALSVTNAVERPLVANPAQSLLERFSSTTTSLSEFGRAVWGDPEWPASRHAVAPHSSENRSQTQNWSRTSVLQTVLREVAAVIDTSPSSIDPERGLVDHGLDSVRGLQLRAQLNREFSVSLPATAIFTYPTATLLAEAIMAQLGNGHHGTEFHNGHNNGAQKQNLQVMSA